jgi:hypothetical protein
MSLRSQYDECLYDRAAVTMNITKSLRLLGSRVQTTSLDRHHAVRLLRKNDKNNFFSIRSAQRALIWKMDIDVHGQVLQTGPFAKLKKDDLSDPYIWDLEDDDDFLKAAAQDVLIQTGGMS